jgi:hypothetical protein
VPAKTKQFTITSAVVDTNHSVIAGTDSIQLNTTSSDSFHAYGPKPGTSDGCVQLVGVCPIPVNVAKLILSTASLGKYQLGTDVSNNGGTGSSSGGDKETSNGQLNVGSGHGGTDPDD